MVVHEMWVISNTGQSVCKCNIYKYIKAKQNYTNYVVPMNHSRLFTTIKAPTYYEV